MIRTTLRFGAWSFTSPPRTGEHGRCDADAAPATHIHTRVGLGPLVRARRLLVDPHQARALGHRTRTTDRSDGSLPEIDVRLRNEVIDWCVTNDRYISLTQLRRNIARMHGGQPPPQLSEFTATVSQLGRRRWPLAADGEPLHVTLSGKSAPPQLPRPALYQLRLRAIFGVSARAEILRVLSLEPSGLAVAQIANRVAYTVRQVALDAEMLTGSSTVHRAKGPGPAHYALSDPSGLAAFVGERPGFCPRWTEPFTTLFHLIGAFQMVASEKLHAPDVEFWRLLRRAEERTTEMRIPHDLRQRPSLEGLAAWAVTAADHSQPVMRSRSRGPPGPRSRERPGHRPLAYRGLLWMPPVVGSCSTSAGFGQGACYGNLRPHLIEVPRRELTVRRIDLSYIHLIEHGGRFGHPLSRRTVAYTHVAAARPCARTPSDHHLRTRHQPARRHRPRRGPCGGRRCAGSRPHLRRRHPNRADRFGTARTLVAEASTWPWTSRRSGLRPGLGDLRARRRPGPRHQRLPRPR